MKCKFILHLSLILFLPGWYAANAQILSEELQKRIATANPNNSNNNNGFRCVR